MTGVELLVWYTLSGGICTLSLWLVAPSTYETPGTVWAAAIPLLGYAIHQLFLIIFEATGGWENAKRRPCLETIKNRFKVCDNLKNSCNPFLIWELTLYGEAFPESLRQQIIRVRHYIFLRNCFRVCLTVGILLLVPLFTHHTNKKLPWLLIVFSTGVTFTIKGIFTKHQLTQLEDAALMKYLEQFKATKNSLCGNTEPGDV